MQQPDYSSAPYYPYPPNPNSSSSSSSTYASAPPFNYPPTPHFPYIPDPTPNPNPNPNPNFHQFTPTPPQTPLSLSSFDPHHPPPVYPQLDPYQSAPNYPHEGNYPKFDQFGPTHVDSGPGHAKFDQFGPTQVDSGSGYAKSDQFGPTRIDLGVAYARIDQSRVDSGSGYSKFDQFGPTRVDSGSGYSKFDQFGPTRVDSGSGYSNFDQFGPTRNDSGPGYPKFDQFGPTRVDSGPGHSKFDQFGGGYAKLDQYGSSRVDSGPGQGGYGDGVYAYQGSKTEPYGARGTGSSSWGGSGSTRVGNGSGFDDFGRPIGSGKGSVAAGGKVVRAVPKAESRQDVSGGVQKFRVKLLAESGGQTNMDVLCQIGLDGIRMLDPTTSRTLRIYPLDTITKFEVLDSSIFAFWAKSPVDIEARRIRLKSNSYTSSTILDIVTAASIQFKEIGGRSRPSETLKPAEQPPEKKKGLGDWMNIIKPGNEEKDHWVPDEAVAKCTSCGTDFGAFVRRHHCRNCGDIFCDKCTHGRITLTAEENAQAVRVCDKCLAEVTHRLNIAKESSNRSSAGLQSHEDLAKKLQEEMERNRRSSSAGSRSDGSGRRMKEVACPTCTVHLQVQVPSSGSETIECGVCQHPFLVSSR